MEYTGQTVNLTSGMAPLVFEQVTWYDCRERLPRRDTSVLGEDETSIVVLVSTLDGTLDTGCYSYTHGAWMFLIPAYIAEHELDRSDLDHYVIDNTYKWRYLPLAPAAPTAHEDM